MSEDGNGTSSRASYKDRPRYRELRERLMRFIIMLKKGDLERSTLLAEETERLFPEFVDDIGDEISILTDELGILEGDPNAGHAFVQEILAYGSESY